MSVTMARTDGVTVFTVTSDPQSACPPLCQILKGLCYSPVCCSVSQHLRRVQGTSQSVLGALHIMVGLLNIGFGAILITHRTSCSSGLWPMPYMGLPYWIGAVFILFGIMNIVSEKRPSPCLVIFNVLLNLAGVGFAITAIIFYIYYIVNIWVGWMCDDNNYGYRYGSRYSSPASSAEVEFLREKCFQARDLVLMIMSGVNGVLIVLSVLELCVAISSVVKGIEALCSSEKREDKSPDDPEHYKALPEEVTSNPTA